MRNADPRRWTVFNPTMRQGRWSRTLRTGLAVLGVGMVIGAHAAHAQDSDDDDDSTFEQKIIKNIMGGIGAIGPNDRGIDYRERSPLVIPPKIDLPPPQSTAAAPAPNWPKDVDEAERKRIRDAEKNRPRDQDNARPLMPSELAAARTKHVTPTEPLQPGTTRNPMLSPSQLGFKGNLFGSLFGQKTESAPFTSEPDRESLTQPPPGYQTPSPNFAYGTGPKQPLAQQGVYDIQTGKEIK